MILDIPIKILILIIIVLINTLVIKKLCKFNKLILFFNHYCQSLKAITLAGDIKAFEKNLDRITTSGLLLLFEAFKFILPALLSLWMLLLIDINFIFCIFITSTNYLILKGYRK